MQKLSGYLRSLRGEAFKLGVNMVGGGRAIWNTTICKSCKKGIRDPVYHRSAKHVRDKCGNVVQYECQKITGLTPEGIDL